MSSTSPTAETASAGGDTGDDDQADLEKLAAELTARGYQADLRTPPGGLPYLEARNPRVSALAEKIYAQAGAFWWIWAERIADCDDVTRAASVLSRVLRTVEGR